jgi:phosphate transport system protein
LPVATMNQSAVSKAAEDLEHEALTLVQGLVHLLDRALDAVVYGDRRHADEVVAAVTARTRHCQRLQEAVMSALGRNPAPDELQILAAVLHISRGAERLGVQCVKIATIVPELADGKSSAIFCELVEPAARVSVSAVWLAKQSFATRDVDLTYEVMRAEVELRRRSRDIYRAALEPGETGAVSRAAMAAFLVGSYLERVCDIAVDLAEQTVIVVDGLFREIADVTARQQTAATV